MPQSQDQPRGVSILQVSLSLLVLTVAASVAIPFWFSRGDVTLENAALLLARDLRLVQDLAVMGNQELTVVFDPDGEGYRVQDGSGALVPAPLGPGGFERRYSKDAVFRGVHFVEVGAGDGDTIRINPAGMVLDSGRVVLGFGGDLRELAIEAGDGRIQLGPDDRQKEGVVSRGDDSARSH